MIYFGLNFTLHYIFFHFSFLFPFFIFLFYFFFRKNSFSFLSSPSSSPSLSLFSLHFRSPSLFPLKFIFSNLSKTSTAHNFPIRRPFDACLVSLESSRREEQFERWFVAGNNRDSPKNCPESSVFLSFAGFPIFELFLEKRAPPSCSGRSKLSDWSWAAELPPDFAGKRAAAAAVHPRRRRPSPPASFSEIG